MQDGRWITRPCDWTRVEALAGELGVSETTATVLVRRGLDDAVEARAFLEADDPRHDPLSLGDMAAAVERIRAAVSAGQRICVGQHMSMVDTVLALAMMLQHLDVEYASPRPVQWETKLTFVPKGGLPVKVRPVA